jgi:RecJ-like exonuclease
MTTSESERGSAPGTGTDRVARDEGGDGRPVVYELPANATIDDIDPETYYLAEVNGVVDYGVFVDVSGEVSGLVHESNLDDATHEAGDELVVELDDVRDNGDVGFRFVAVDEYDLIAVPPEYDVTPTGELAGLTGEEVVLEGQVVQANQTGGPTVFQVRDRDGIVPCAAFEAAGVRAYPEVGLDDPVRVFGDVERRDGSVQVEVNDLERLDGDDGDVLVDRVETAIETRAAPNDVDPLVEWPALDVLWEDLETVAYEIRRAVLDGRPIRVRHHADGDGMCAAVPLEMAVERFIETTHADPTASRHLFKRLPSKAPFYEMEDATRDLNFALGDRDRHGQKLPLVMMLDNGSTEEDVPAYETLGHYDLPLLAIDHHHPDPEAVEQHLTAHVNPYLRGEDYRVTTGMLSVELARMIAPGVTDEISHVPAIAGLADRSETEAMDQYLNLAAQEGYDHQDLKDVSEALDYAAYHLRYDAGRGLLNDLLNVGCDDRGRHRRLVELFADRSRTETDRQLSAAGPHVEGDHLANGARLYRVDVENHAHRFTYPAPGKTTGAIHDRKVRETGDPVITIGYGPDFAVLRSDGVRLDIPRMVTELDEGIVGGGVSGGGHLVVGSIKFLPGRREEVLEALVEKMAEAEIDESLGSASTAPLDD